MNNLLLRTVRMDAHYRLFIALGVATLVFFVVSWFEHTAIRLIAAWVSFALTLVVLAWLRIIFSNAREIVHVAKIQDSSRRGIFLFVVFAALASIFAVAVLLGPSKGLSGFEAMRHVVLTVTTVASSWLLIHTLFTLRYAHLFYRLSDRDPAHTEGSGLTFPGTSHPDFMDFAYFSFVLGMACQTSDVVITSRSMRRIVLLHSVLSFIYNTMILALTLNLASGLF